MLCRVDLFAGRVLIFNARARICNGKCEADAARVYIYGAGRGLYIDGMCFVMGVDGSWLL